MTRPADWVVALAAGTAISLFAFAVPALTLDDSAWRRPLQRVQAEYESGRHAASVGGGMLTQNMRAVAARSLERAGRFDRLASAPATRVEREWAHVADSLGADAARDSAAIAGVRPLLTDASDRELLGALERLLGREHDLWEELRTPPDRRTRRTAARAAHTTATVIRDYITAEVGYESARAVSIVGIEQRQEQRRMFDVAAALDRRADTRRKSLGIGALLLAWCLVWFVVRSARRLVVPKAQQRRAMLGAERAVVDAPRQVERETTP